MPTTSRRSEAFSLPQSRQSEASAVADSKPGTLTRRMTNAAQAGVRACVRVGGLGAHGASP